MNKSSLAILQQGLNLLSIPHHPTNIEQICKYVDELLLFNTRFDLVNADTDEQIVVRHILDSLAGYSAFTEASPKTIADIGSGAGFPGIPLAVFLPHVRFTLVERSERRSVFLQNITAMLKLKNATVRNSDAAALNEQFAAVTSRALTTLDAKILKRLLRLTVAKGKLILYKGNAEKTATELQSLRAELVVAGASFAIRNVQVPFLENQRCLVVIDKS